MSQKSRTTKALPDAALPPEDHPILCRPWVSGCRRRVCDLSLASAPLCLQQNQQGDLRWRNRWLLQPAPLRTHVLWQRGEMSGNPELRTAPFDCRLDQQYLTGKTVTQGSPEEKKQVNQLLSINALHTSCNISPTFHDF